MAPPSILINCGVFRYCFKAYGCAAVLYAAMASGLVSTIAFVVHLPMLRPGTILHEALVDDGLPVDASLDVSTWLEEATRLTHRDLPEFVPVTRTATEALTEHTKMRVNQRVYITNYVAMPSQFHLPFVIHWNYSGGMALRALDIKLPVLDYHPRFSLQDYLPLGPVRNGPRNLHCAVTSMSTLSQWPQGRHGGNNIPVHANGTPSAGRSLLSRRSSRAKPPEEAQLARHRPLSGVTNSTLSRPKISPRWVVTACVNYGRVLGLG